MIDWLKNKLLGSDEEVLVLTLLVKNEADIIVDNIFFHYAKDVDFIIVTDNGSTDGTYELLQSLANEGLIELYREELYNQDKIVNHMGEVARNKYKATLLIHADADEFWTPTSSESLKEAFLQVGQPAVLVDRKDALPTPQYRRQAFPQKEMYIVKKHLVSDNVEEDSKRVSLFLFRLPPKVMFSIKDEFRNVTMGNHLLAGAHSGDTTGEIVIKHFPFKSADRFIEKVVMAGEAMKKVKTSKETWWHWKRWYREYQNGTLNNEIEILVPDPNKVEGLQYDKFNYTEEIIKPIMSSKKKLVKKYIKYKGQV